MAQSQDTQTVVEARDKYDTVSFKVEPRLNAAVQKLAGSMGLNKSGLIRMAVIDYLRRTDPVLYAMFLDEESN